MEILKQHNKTTKSRKKGLSSSVKTFQFLHSCLCLGTVTVPQSTPEISSDIYFLVHGLIMKTSLQSELEFINFFHKIFSFYLRKLLAKKYDFGSIISVRVRRIVYFVYQCYLVVYIDIHPIKNVNVVL